jgi:CRISPR-associated RAMP protein (TIGR02581 family)
MFDRFTNRLSVTGTLVARTALRVGTGRSYEPVGVELPVLRDTRGRPLIPGASLKGVYRSYAESLVRAVTSHPGGACAPTADESRHCLDSARVEQLKRDAVGDRALAEAIWDESCLICRTFGSPWLASHVEISDLVVDEATWFGQFQVRDGVAVDRDTGTVARGLLYDYEVVPAGTGFACKIVAEGVEDWQLGMLWLGLQRLYQGEMAVGGFRSRGLGTVKLEDAETRYFDLGPEGTRASRLIDYVVADRPGESVGPEEARDWVKAFRTRVRELAQQEA